MIYDKFPEKACEIGGIDIVGVVSAASTTAVVFSGASVLKKYFDGSKKVQLSLQISGMSETDEQKPLIDKMCGILQRLVSGKWEIEGAEQVRCSIANYPIPAVKNERYWIYKAGINIDFSRRRIFK